MDIYIAMEESYKKGYIKGVEDTKKTIAQDVIQKLQVTNQRIRYRYGEGLVFQCRIQGGGVDIFVEQEVEPYLPEEYQEGHARWIVKNDYCFCSNCQVCGSPQWKRCPVCEAKMEVELEDPCPDAKSIKVEKIGKEVKGYGET